MKRLLSVILCITAMLGGTVMAEDEVKPIVVKVDGVAITTDQAPVNMEGKVLVPLRAIFESLGAEVYWDESGIVTAKKEDSEFSLKIGEAAYTLNGKKYETDIAAQIIHDRTMVPLRVVSESMGCAVNWLEAKNTVDVATPAHQAVVAETDRIRAIQPQIDEVYKEVDGTKLPIKIYKLENSQNSKTAVLAIHGGGWYAVKGEWEQWSPGWLWMNYQAQYYYDKYGYTTAVISYRSINLNEETEVSDLIEDCKDALKYFRENAEFDKLIVIGDSSGAHLAVELGLDDECDINIVVAANPVLDLNTERWEYTAKTEEARIAASPSFNTKLSDTKFLCIHGNADTVVDHEITKKFCEDMQALGTQCDYVELDGINHAFILSRYQSTDEQINEYMTMIDEYIAGNL